MLLAPLQAALLAHRVSRHGRIGTLGLAVVVAAFVLSLASGSKGAFFLWIASIAALVDYRRARIKRSWLLLTGTALLGALWYTAATVSSFLDIPVSEFVQLALGRFFLSNDARALAFDVRWQSSGSGDLLRESFRSLSGLWGNAPRDPPLGLLLYSEYLGTEGLLGANASLMALITYYFPAGYALLPALLAATGAAVLYRTILAVRTMARTRWVGLAVAVWGLLMVQQLSQDFLAFQLVLPMFAVAVGALLMLERIGVRRGRQPLPDLTPVSPSLASHAHHRHSGS